MTGTAWGVQLICHCNTAPDLQVPVARYDNEKQNLFQEECEDTVDCRQFTCTAMMLLS